MIVADSIDCGGFLLWVRTPGRSCIPCHRAWCVWLPGGLVLERESAVGRLELDCSLCILFWGDNFSLVLLAIWLSPPCHLLMFWMYVFFNLYIDMEIKDLLCEFKWDDPVYGCHWSVGMREIEFLCIESPFLTYQTYWQYVSSIKGCLLSKYNCKHMWLSHDNYKK